MYFDSKATLLRSDCTIVKSEALPGTSFAVRLHMSAILLTMTSGCGTVLDLDAGLNSGVGPHIYGGVRADADMIGNPYPDAAEFVVLLGVLDFPFSLALDTALLPITLPVSALCPEDDSHEPANADFKSIDKAFARASSMRILSTGIAALRAEDRYPSIKFAASFELKGRQKVRWDVRWEGATADSG